MEFAVLVVNLCMNGLTLVVLIGGGVRLLTRLESGLTEVKADLVEHTAEEEKRFDQFRARFHDLNGVMAAVQIEQGRHDTRITHLEKAQ